MKKREKLDLSGWGMVQVPKMTAEIGSEKCDIDQPPQRASPNSPMRRINEDKTLL